MKVEFPRVPPSSQGLTGAVDKYLCLKCKLPRPKVCTGAGRRVCTDDMLVAMRSLHSSHGEEIKIAGRSHTEAGPMLLSKLTDCFDSLRDENFAVWKQEVEPTYFLNGVGCDPDTPGGQIVDELVKCLAFDREHALQVAPSQDEMLEMLQKLKLQGYVDENLTGWYLTAMGRKRINYCRPLGAPGEYVVATNWTNFVLCLKTVMPVYSNVMHDLKKLWTNTFPDLLAGVYGHRLWTCRF